jgi:hypothetical protein
VCSCFRVKALVRFCALGVLPPSPRLRQAAEAQRAKRLRAKAAGVDIVTTCA